MVRFGIQRPTIHIKRIRRRPSVAQDPAFTVHFDNGHVVETNFRFLHDQNALRSWIARTLASDLHPGPMSQAQWVRYVDRLITATERNRRELSARRLFGTIAASIRQLFIPKSLH